MLDPFHAFYLKHRQCGSLETGRLDEGTANVGTVWLSCSCGARVEKAGFPRHIKEPAEDKGSDEFVQALDAFYLEHRKCGDLESGLDQKRTAEVIVWMACSCGAQLARHVPPDNTKRSEGGE